MDNLGWGLQMTVLGMGLVFALLVLLWGLLRFVLRLDRTAARQRPTRPRRRRTRRRVARPTRATAPRRRHRRRAGRRDHRRGAHAPGGAPARGRAVDAQLLAGQPALRVALGGAAGACGRTGAGSEEGR